MVKASDIFSDKLEITTFINSEKRMIKMGNECTFLHFFRSFKVCLKWVLLSEDAFSSVCLLCDVFVLTLFVDISLLAANLPLESFTFWSSLDGGARVFGLVHHYVRGLTSEYAPFSSFADNTLRR